MYGEQKRGGPPAPPSSSSSSSPPVRRALDVTARAFSDALLHTTSKFEDGVIENTPKFVQCLIAIHDLYEAHLMTNPTAAPLSFGVPPTRTFLQYWARAPAHHFSTNEGDTLAESVWLAEAMGNAIESPGEVGPTQCGGSTVLGMHNALATFRDTWCITPFRSNLDEYERNRRKFMAFTLFIIPEGVERLMERGLLGRSSDFKRRRAIGREVRPLPDAAAAAAAAERKKGGKKRTREGEREGKEGKGEGSDGDDDDDDGDGGEEDNGEPKMDSVGPKRPLTAEQLMTLQHQKELFRASSAVTTWLAQCARTFPFVDAIAQLFRDCPIAPIPPATTKIPMREASEAIFTRWMVGKVQNVMPEEFRVAFERLACRLMLPIGSVLEYQRNPGAGDISYLGLFRSAYGSDAGEAMDQASLLHTSKIYAFGSNKDGESGDEKGKEGKEGKEEAKDLVSIGAADIRSYPHHMRYLRDGVILHTHHDAFYNRMDKYNWLETYFVDASNLRAKMQMLQNTREAGRRRMHRVVHIGDGYYVHNGKNMIQTSGAVQALWYWNWCLAHEFKSRLPTGEDANTRWTAQFAVRST